MSRTNVIRIIVGLVIGLGAWPELAVAQSSTHYEPGEREETAAGGGDSSNPEASNLVGARRATEWMVGAGVAKSLELFHSRSGIRYGVQTVSWAREVSGDHGPGVLRGRLAWAVEVMTMLAESSPTRLYGFGVAPIGARWNFVPRRHWSAFTELIGGVLASSAAIPDGLARFNFTAHWGTGVRFGLTGGQSVVVAYRLHHVSNGNRLPDNPGVNSHVAFAGWSMTRQ